MNLKSLLPYWLRQTIKRRVFAFQDMHARLANLRRAGFHPVGAVDGGAFDGDWAQEFWRTWPSCPVMMVEPQAECRERLMEHAGKAPGSIVCTCAISDRSGRAAFRYQETNSAIVDAADAADDDGVEVRTLAELLSGHDGFDANLLKLDLQGHELKALAGAGRSLPGFEVIILEMSLIGIDGMPEFHEVHSWLDANGYRLYDVLPMYYRPRDGALWQMDAFYVRKDSALCQSKQWN
ncbi:MAG: hypothetical protein CMP07_09405 [Xanthomonadales bacterium]|nr:hypothetical protein [Xanthomonadales bacterium]